MKKIKKKKTIEDEGIITRTPLGVSGQLLKSICVITSLYHLYIAYFGAPYSMMHRPLHFTLIFIIMFILYPASQKNLEKSGKIPFYDWVLIVLTIFSAGYLIVNVEGLMDRIPFVTKISLWQNLFGACLILIVLIATYRVIGKTLCIVTTIFLLYGYFGKYLPGPFWHRGYSISRIIEQLYLTVDGIWSTPLHVTSTFVFLFILFGSFLVVTGAGSFFTDLAFSLTHKMIGGPAKTAIVASSLMGTLSGSSTANVVTTGSFTIPMMKKIGYRPEFAGAVEAVASTGGQIMPPVMGAAAFIMAEFTGIAYVNIMKHAIIPALLYYLGVFVMVHIEAVKVGIKTYLDKDAPRAKEILLSRGYMFIPLIAIVYFLFKGYTPLRSAFFAIVILIILEFIKSKDKKNFFKVVINGLVEAPKVVAPVTIACACAGIIVGIIGLTGLGQRITSIILTVSGGYLPIILILTMLLAIILGMGMPTSSAYIVMAALLAPALVRMGVPLISAHMFIFYFACLSAITPPVALASYAGAALAGASPGRTGYMGFRLGLAAYIVPFMFVYGPSLLMIGKPSTILLTIVTAVLGIFSLGFAVQRWLYIPINLFQQILLFASAILLIKPGLYTDMPGIIILALLAFNNSYLLKKRNKL